MSLMPPKVIGRKTCLQIKSPFGLSKEFRPKKSLNILKKYESKEIRVSMKVEEGGVHTNLLCIKKHLAYNNWNLTIEVDKKYMLDFNLKNINIQFTHEYCIDIF